MPSQPPAKAPQDEVARALAAARKLPASEPSAVGQAATWVASKTVPKRKTVVRAFIFALLGMLPLLMLVTLAKPLVMLPVLLAVVALLYLLGAGEDVAKQLRWMKNMSKRGPIFWIAERFNKWSIVLARKFYGAKMDVLPKAPAALGTTARGATRAVVKWIPQHVSQYSTEVYEVEMRHAPREEMRTSSDDGERPWVSLTTELASDTLELKPLTADVDYEVRVRAVNSKGPSEWRELAFSTKQAALKSADGEKAGGVGPGYTWQQSLKDETISVVVGPLPAGTRAKQLSVAVMPTTLKVLLESGGSKAPLVQGELFDKVDAEDVEWELRDAAEGGKGARELVLQLTKKGGKSIGSNGPLWPQLLTNGPEVDVSGLKRVEKDMQDMLAELQQSTGMHHMDGIEYAKSMREGLDLK